MLYFVAQTYKETKIVCCVFVDRRRSFIQAALKFPVFEGSGFRSVEFSSFPLLIEVSIFGSLLAKVGVQQVGPRDVHQNNECLGFEGHMWIVEDADCAQSRLPRLREKLICEGADCANASGHVS